MYITATGREKMLFNFFRPTPGFPEYTVTYPKGSDQCQIYLKVGLVFYTGETPEFPRFLVKGDLKVERRFGVEPCKLSNADLIPFWNQNVMLDAALTEIMGC